MTKRTGYLIVGLLGLLFWVLPSNAAPIKMDAEPEAIDLELERTAVVVVDMQNAFISKGGFFDLMGFDVVPNQKIIEPIKKVCDAARAKGMKVIYAQYVFSPDLREVGPNSSFWNKSLKNYREKPDWKDKYIIRGTWGAEIVDDLKPQKSDIVVEKSRFSAFYNTNLDMILKTYNLKNLLFTGCATNICVEATIRDAAPLGYFPILISDGTINNGPPFMQQATIFNMKLVYGWVTNVENVLKAIK